MDHQDDEHDNSRFVNGGLHQRKHSVSVSSKSHKTDMNGHVYSSDPSHPPPLASLHRSPSFDKRLIDSARHAGQDIADEEEVESFTCAGVCRGSCCAPTSSTSSHYDPPAYMNGRKLTTNEIIALRKKYDDTHHRGWYCHKPEWSFIFKVIGVLAVIAAGVVLSVLIYSYLHASELHNWRDNMNLLCLERSKSIQSQLNFSTAVLAHQKAYYSVIKNGSPTGRLLPFGTQAYVDTFSTIAEAESWLDIFLFTSILRNGTQVAEWQSAYDMEVSAYRSVNGTGRLVPYTSLVSDAFTEEWFDARPSRSVTPVEFVYPKYAPVDLHGWDIGGFSNSIFSNLLKAARLGSPICSNRSTLLQSTGYGIIVTMAAYTTPTVIPELSLRESECIGGVMAIIPISKVVESALLTLDPQPIDLTLYDRSAPERTAFLYDYHFESSESIRNQTEWAENEATSSFFTYGTRSFEVACKPTVSFVDSGYSQTPLLVGVGCAILFGIVLIMVVLGCLYASMRRAIARSAQLIQANRNKNMALDLLHEAKHISDEANRSKSDFLAFLCHEVRQRQGIMRSLYPTR